MNAVSTFSPALDDLYRGFYGERWQTLKDAMQRPDRLIARSNGFATLDPSANSPDGVEGNIPRDALGLRLYYYMDAASIHAARVLDPAPGMEVLDACSAPGGKGLILAEAMEGQGMLVLNDVSRQRLHRLKTVMRDYLPEHLRNWIRITGMDARRIHFKNQGRFDRILADVPCSAERHLLNHPGELARWSASRPRQNAIRQYAILSSLFLSLKPGGRLVYSTCSVCPLENDAVIEKLTRRRPDARVPSVPAPFGEPTACGWIMLPDRSPGGPLFYAVVERVA